MIHLIAAVDTDGGIGLENHLLCHIPADLKHFKKLTMGHPIIMGRKTFESLPGILPGRPHFVLTRQPEYGEDKSDIEVFSSVEDVLPCLDDHEDYFVIGGESIYEAFFPLSNSLYLTEIAEAFTADAFFPVWNRDEWYAAEVQPVPMDTKNKYSCRFVHYVRKQEL